MVVLPSPLAPSASLSFSAISDVVATLRAAGCVFAEEEAELLLGAARTPADLATMVGRRVAGLPLEHVLGWREFCGLRIGVEPGVFVPRRRTEFLVHCAAGLIRRRSVVVDLCCGSGAVGVALSAMSGEVDLHAVDIDPAAVRCARRNVAAIGGHVYEGDLIEPLPTALRGRIEVLVANAPYVPSGEVRLLPREARMHESLVALDGGTDGLDVLRRLAVVAPVWLAPGGHLLVETSAHQAPRGVEILTSRGLSTGVAHSDEWDATVLIAARQAGRLGETRGLTGNAR